MVTKAALKRLSPAKIQELLKSRIVEIKTGHTFLAASMDFTGWNKEELIDFYLNTQEITDTDLLKQIMSEMKKQFKHVTKDNVFILIQALLNEHEEKEEKENITD